MVWYSIVKKREGLAITLLHKHPMKIALAGYTNLFVHFVVRVPINGFVPSLLRNGRGHFYTGSAHKLLRIYL